MKKNASANIARQSQHLAPPLRIWVAVFIITVTIGTLSLLGFKQDQRIRLQSFAGSRGSGYENRKVIALGSSLLDCATFSDEGMQALSANSGMLKLKFMKITRPAMSFDQLLPLLDDILAAEPDILLIERDIIFYHPDPPQFNPRQFDREFFSKHSDFIRRLLKGTYSNIKMMLSAESRTEQSPMSTDILYEDTENIPVMRLDSVFSQYAEWRKHLSGPEQYVNRNLVEAFLSKANKIGVRIVLLELPRSQEASSVIPASQEKIMSAFAAEYYRRYSVLSLRLPEKLSLKYFIDYSHLNAKGRKLFSQWLLAKIRDVVGERP